MDNNIFLGAKTKDYVLAGILSGIGEVAKYKADIAKIQREIEEERRQQEADITKSILLHQLKMAEQREEKRREEEAKKKLKEMDIGLKEELVRRRMLEEMRLKEEAEEKKEKRKAEKESELRIGVATNYFLQNIEGRDVKERNVKEMVRETADKYALTSDEQKRFEANLTKRNYFLPSAKTVAIGTIKTLRDGQTWVSDRKDWYKVKGDKYFKDNKWYPLFELERKQETKVPISKPPAGWTRRQ